MNYLPVNAAPVVDDIVVATGARVNPQSQSLGQSQTVSIAFGSSASSSDGSTTADPTASSPLTAARDRLPSPCAGPPTTKTAMLSPTPSISAAMAKPFGVRSKKKISEKAYSFDATLIPDGGYQVKVVASDAPSHSPADALTGEKISDRFEVDTTPPAITGLKALRGALPASPAPCSNKISVTFDAQSTPPRPSPAQNTRSMPDRGTILSRSEKSPTPKPNITTSDVAVDEPAGKTSEHLITVRAYDRFDNVGVAKTVIPAQEK